MGELIQVGDCLEEWRVMRSVGLDRGDPPGWPSFNRYYRVLRGMMTVVTGMPSSGKSTFVDAMMVNLATNHGWKFAVFSPENYPVALHMAALAEKYTGKSVKGEYDYYQMSDREERDAIEFLSGAFTWIYPKEDVTLDRILSNAKKIKEMTGLDGLVIDPWNELEHNRGNKTETEHISESLTKIRRFSRENKVHTWIVAHPMKMPKNKFGGYDVPTPYDISGSAHFRNKADFCLCVHRENLLGTEVDVHIQKVKFRHLGMLGVVSFNFSWINGRYTSLEDK